MKSRRTTYRVLPFLAAVILGTAALTPSAKASPLTCTDVFRPAEARVLLEASVGQNIRIGGGLFKTGRVFTIEQDLGGGDHFRVFKVTDGTRSYTLKVLKHGPELSAFIEVEVEALAKLAELGIPASKVIATDNKTYLLKSFEEGTTLSRLTDGKDMTVAADELVRLQETLQTKGYRFADLWGGNILFHKGRLIVIDPGGAHRLKPDEKVRLFAREMNPGVAKAANLLRELRETHGSELPDAEIKTMVADFLDAAKMEDNNALSVLERSYSSDEKKAAADQLFELLKHGLDPNVIENTIDKVLGNVRQRSNWLTAQLHDYWSKEIRRRMAPPNAISNAFFRTRDPRFLDLFVRSMIQEMAVAERVDSERVSTLANALQTSLPSWRDPIIELDQRTILATLKLVDRLAPQNHSHTHLVVNHLIPHIARNPKVLADVGRLNTPWIVATIARNLDPSAYQGVSRADRLKITALYQDTVTAAPGFASTLEPLISSLRE